MLEDNAATENLVIDVLETVRECPPYVPAVRPSLPDEDTATAKGRQRFRCGAPLLAIRYLHNSHKLPDFEARLAAFQQTMPSGSDRVSQHAAKQMGCECGVGKVHAASLAEIAEALRTLSANEAMLSADYTTWFYGLSAQHGEASGFRPSFLVPPMEPKGAKPPPVCCGCDKQQAAGGTRFQQCERCGSYFCSKACLVANWKEHKKVCRKTEDKLDAFSHATSNDAHRKSVLFDLRPSPDKGGFFANISMTGAASSMPSRRVDPTQAPKNVHGSREFIVKVQTPGNYSPQAECMVYDEVRSFQSFMPLATHGVEAVLELIRHYGVHKAAGSKGYFLARREGTRLRIFADKILPPPSW